MLKSVCFIAIRIVAILLILFPIFWSPVWAENTVPSQSVKSSSSEVVNTQAVKQENLQVQPSHCNQKNGEGKIMMNSNCQKVSPISSPQRTYPQPPNPYDMKAIERFDRELYGE